MCNSVSIHHKYVFQHKENGTYFATVFSLRLQVFMFSLGHRLTEHTVLRATTLEVYEMDTVGLLMLFEVRNSVNHALFGVICKEVSFSSVSRHHAHSD